MTAALALAAGVAGLSSVQASERSDRAAKAGALSFRVASSVATADFEKMVLRSGEVIYVSPTESFSNRDVASSEAVAARDGEGLSLSLSTEAALRLASDTRATGADRLAIVKHGKLVSAGTIESVSSDGTRVSRLPVGEASRLSRMIGSGQAVAAGPVLTLVPHNATGGPGELFSVDVYVSGVGNLRTYQVAVDAVGGAGGALVREAGQIDSSRADYVFGSAQVINAVDESGGRMGGVLFSGAVDASSMKYLGTYNFRATADASGAFDIQVRPIDTFLSDGRNERIAHGGPSTTIHVGR
jgi:hypothetical protein